jgi:hypothetical protein
MTIYADNTQIYFNDTMNDAIFSSQFPYNTRPSARVRNEQDETFSPFLVANANCTSNYSSCAVTFNLGIPFIS